MRIGSPLVFVDLETTGGTSASRILEVGLIRVEGNVVTDSFQTLLNPIGYVPAMITRLTGITKADVQDAPSFAEVAPSIIGLLEGATFVAHNVGFDYGFLRRELGRIGFELDMPRLCTVELSRRLFPQYRHHNLEELIARHGLEVRARHRAYDDAMALWQLWQLMLHEHDLDTVEAAMSGQLGRRQPVHRARPMPPRLALARVGDV